MPAILERAKPGRRAEGLKIGIVNNMPDAALLSTARQFLNVIETAAPELRIFVSLYSLSGVQRSDAGRRHLAENSYQDFAQLVAADLDAVIVTGTEPRQASPRSGVTRAARTVGVSIASRNASAIAAASSC